MTGNEHLRAPFSFLKKIGQLFFVHEMPRKKRETGWPNLFLAMVFAACLSPFGRLDAQCSPTALEIPNNGIDEDCDGLDNFYLTLPPFAYTVVGQDFEIYFRNLILSTHPNDYVFEVTTALNGINSGQKWAFTPTLANVGTHDLSIKIKTPGGTVLGTASTKIRVSTNAAPADMAAKKAILYGHSFFDQGYLPVYLSNLLAQPGNPPISFHGKKASWATPFTKHEGYGGFMWRWFIQSPASPFSYNGKMNLRQYFDDVCGGPGKRPDFMVIHLDINDFCGYTALAGNTLQEIDDSITNDWNQNARRILDSIRVAAPNCKLGICISPPGNARESAFATTYGGNPVLNNRWRWQKIISRIIAKNIERYSNREAENIFLIPEQLDIDDFGEYNPPDARHPDPADNNINTHCGYNEVAKTIYAWVKYIENLGAAPPPNGNTWFQDADGDGFGNLNISQNATVQPTGFVSNPTDCNDANAAVNPATAEICGNNIDDNCNGQIDESLAPTGYCTAVSAYPWEDWIAGVKIGAVEKTSSKTTYSDHTATVFPLAATNTITLSSGFSFTVFDEYWRVWIDLNRDGDFNDAGEMVAEKLAPKPAAGTTLSSTTASFSMTSALCGSTRMRVSMTRLAFPATACATLAFGETEDFSVTFAGGPPPPGKPDLTITSLTAPASAVIGQPAPISFSIKNMGTDAAAQTVGARAFLSSDNLLGGNDLSLGQVNFSMPAIGASANATLSFTIAAGQPVGPYFLLIKTDDADLIAELDETNNLFTQGLSVVAAPPAGQPDLIVASMTAPASAIAGTTTAVSFSIKNIGTAAGAQNVATSFYLSTDNLLTVNDLSLGVASVSMPAAGSSATATLNFQVAAAQVAGSYFLISKADDPAQIAELDEANNVFSQAFSVTAPTAGQPDLTIPTATLPNAATVGVPVAASFTIKNQGTATAAISITSAIYLSTDNVLSINDLSLGSSSVAVPAAGGSATVNMTLTVAANQPTGAYFLIVSTDDSGLLPESNETNNRFSQAISVNPVAVQLVPDLEFTGATIPASMVAGGAAAVSFSIKNNGTAAVPANFSTSAWLSTDNIISVTDVFLGSFSAAPLAIGATVSGSLNFTLAMGQPAGNYFLLLKADTGNAIAELSETNNTFAQNTVVTNPNPATYCASASNFPWHDWISKVKVNSPENPSDKTQYSNFTSVAPFTITKNTNNSVKLSASYSSEVFEEYWRIWVDFNKDGDFLDGNELVFSQKMAKPAAGALTATLTSAFGVSSSAATGTTRMRVAMKRGAIPPTPCEVLPFGEVEDYTVVVVAQNNAATVPGRDSGGDGDGIDLLLLPNPTDGQFSIALPDFLGENIGIKVFNALGKPVLELPATELKTRSIDLDLGGKPAGTYFVFVEIEGFRPECRRLVLVEK